jgi:hypothetical protein
LEWLKLETSGKAPEPRYMHSMNFYEEGNFLIIYGGRNDFLDSNAFNDIHILELKRLEWTGVSVFSDTDIDVFSRYGHSALVYCKELLHQPISY